MTPTSLEAFFARNPVFTVEDVDRFLGARRPNRPLSRGTRQSLLSHYTEQGRLQRVRRGLYATRAPGSEGGPLSVDAFLIATRLAPDAVLAYHTALEFHGFAHSVRDERIFLSERKLVRPTRFAGVSYRAVRPPAALPAGDRLTLGVETHDRQGEPIRVTTLERTLVDVLDRPALSGGWEEVWRSLEGVDAALDFAALASYARLLGSASTAARLGYALEIGQDRLAVPDAILESLRRLAPRQPHPAERGLRGDTRLVRGWNLLVPATEANEPGMVEEGDWDDGALAQGASE